MGQSRMERVRGLELRETKRKETQTESHRLDLSEWMTDINSITSKAKIIA